MESSWTSLLYNWAPVLLMIAFWFYIMRKVTFGRQGKYLERSTAFMDRQEQLLERIAIALEQRNSR